MEPVESAAAPSFAAMARAAIPAIEETPAVEVAVVEPSAVEAPQVEAAPEAVVEPVTAPATVERATFESRLKSRGYAVDDVDPEILYDQAIERLTQGSAAIEEVARLQAELQALRSAPPQVAAPVQAAAPVAPQEPAQPAAPNRLFRELKKFDAGLEQFVTFDGKGHAVAKPELGVQAIEAARTINEFYTLESDQISRLVRNPHALLQDYKDELEAVAKQEAKAYLDAQLAAMRAEQEAERASREAASQTEAQFKQQNDWHEANKAAIFRLDANGVPMKQPFDQKSPALTAVGSVFMEKYWDLQAKAPGVNQFTLMDIALEYAVATAPKTAAPTPAPAPAPVVAAAPAVTPAEQRRQFINQRVAIPNQSTPSASLHELTTDQPGRLRFADMVRNNPAVSEIINNW